MEKQSSIMVSTKIFFFKLDDESFFSVFDLHTTYDNFDVEDFAFNKVFVDSEPTTKWDFADDEFNAVFDDQDLYRALTTEDDEDLVCEDGSTILIW